LLAKFYSFQEPETVLEGLEEQLTIKANLALSTMTLVTNRFSSLFNIPKSCPKHKSPGTSPVKYVHQLDILTASALSLNFSPNARIWPSISFS
jgi:hypothetical protein